MKATIFSVISHCKDAETQRDSEEYRFFFVPLRLCGKSSYTHETTVKHTLCH